MTSLSQELDSEEEFARFYRASSEDYDGRQVVREKKKETRVGRRRMRRKKRKKRRGFESGMSLPTSSGFGRVEGVREEEFLVGRGRRRNLSTPPYAIVDRMISSHDRRESSFDMFKCGLMLVERVYISWRRFRDAAEIAGERNHERSGWNDELQSQIHPIYPHDPLTRFMFDFSDSWLLLFPFFPIAP